jgi:hypothetical protein
MASILSHKPQQQGKQKPGSYTSEDWWFTDTLLLSFVTQSAGVQTRGQQQLILHTIAPPHNNLPGSKKSSSFNYSPPHTTTCQTASAQMMALKHYSNHSNDGAKLLALLSCKPSTNQYPPLTFQLCERLIIGPHTATTSTP